MQTTPVTSNQRNKVLALILSLACAVVLILAALSKLTEYGLWAADIHAHKFLGFASSPLAVFVPALELTLGYAILFSTTRDNYSRWILILFAGFLVYQVLRSTMGTAWGFPGTGQCKCIKLPASFSFGPVVRGVGFLFLAVGWYWAARNRLREKPSVG